MRVEGPAAPPGSLAPGTQALCTMPSVAHIRTSFPWSRFLCYIEELG